MQEPIRLIFGEGRRRWGMRKALHAKAKAQPGFRFYVFCDKVHRADIVAQNNSWNSDKPADIEANFATWKISPNGVNWGVSDPLINDTFEKIMSVFDQAEQDRFLVEAHSRIVDQAYQLWVAHDINVHAANPNVRGFITKVSWIKDFTSIYIEE